MLNKSKFMAAMILPGLAAYAGNQISPGAGAPDVWPA